MTVFYKLQICAHNGCKTNPLFDFPGGKGKYCVVHKLPDMVDVKHKRCEHEGCPSVNPAFDLLGGRGRFCGYHKLENMVNVKSKKCLAENCPATAPVVNQ